MALEELAGEGIVSFDTDLTIRREIDRVARFTSGLPDEPASSAARALGERSALGLKLGEEAITCKAPVRG